MKGEDPLDPCFVLWALVRIFVEYLIIQTDEKVILRRPASAGNGHHGRILLESERGYLVSYDCRELAGLQGG